MSKYILFIISGFIIGCSDKKPGTNNNTQIQQPMDTVIFSYHGINSGKDLNLLSNGRFIDKSYSFSCLGGGEKTKVFGTYTMDSTNLILKPEQVKLMVYPVNGDLKPEKTLKTPYGPDSLKIKTEFQIVQWNNTKYLFSDHLDINWSLNKENDYMRFANYLNSGSEPEYHGWYLVSENSEKDTIKSPFDLNQIPEKWQRYFLRKPISAKIKDIKKQINPDKTVDISWSIQLNKGELDGIYKGLTFKTQEGEFFIKIDSILPNKCFGTTYWYNFSPKKYPINTELRTKWK